MVREVLRLSSSLVSGSGPQASWSYRESRPSLCIQFDSLQPELECALQALWPCLHQWSRLDPKLMNSAGPGSRIVNTTRSSGAPHSIKNILFHFSWARLRRLCGRPVQLRSRPVDTKSCFLFLHASMLMRVRVGIDRSTLAVEDGIGTFEHGACVQPRTPRNAAKEPFWHDGWVRHATAVYAGLL